MHVCPEVKEAPTVLFSLPVPLFPDLCARIFLLVQVPGIQAALTGVRVPLGKSFGFLEFSSHEAAQEAL